MGEGLTPLSPKIVRDQQQLTEEQEAYAREFAQERVAAMLSTEPVDEKEAEEHLRAVYRTAGVNPPTTIRWFDSPLTFVQACVPYYVRISVQDDLWTRVKARVWACVPDKAADSMWPSILDSIEANGLDIALDNMWPSSQDIVKNDVLGIKLKRVGYCVRQSVWAIMEGSTLNYRPQTQNNLGAIMLNSVWEGEGVRTIELDSMWDSVSDSVWSDMKKGVTNSVTDSVRAIREAHMLACYRFFHEVYEENKLIHLSRLSEMVSGYRLGIREAWLVRKPTSLERDAQGRLHSATGPCIQYRNGWGIYAWHGIRVSEKLIMHPEQVTREDCTGQMNAEVRRAIQERLGNERFVDLIGGKCIDKGRRGNLFEVDLGSDFRERVEHYVQVQDSSTARHYYLRVPPSISSADEAIAWTFGLDARDYQPGQET